MTTEARTIPEDIMESAKSALNDAVVQFLRSDAYVVIARAILAERERCAVIAEGNAKGFDLQRALADGDDMVVGAKSVQLAIARKIRGEG